MSERGFLTRHGIVRSAIREDVLFFAIPALVLWVLGLVVCNQDGELDRFWSHLWSLMQSPSDVLELSAARACGLAMFLGGIGFASVSMATLRRNYAATVIIREGHELVTHGVYRVVRHPIYLGVLVAMNGLPAYTTSGWGAVIMAALIPVFLNRIRLEERLLAQEFGKAWEAYCQRTPKIVPFLY